MSAYLCELAWTGEESVERDVLIEVDGERIARVAPGTSETPAGATRLAGVTIPGLANAHSHAFQRALRGRTQGEAGSFWTWREQMYALAGRIDPDGYLALARATFAEMAMAGITTVGEFHYLHHGPGGARYDNPNAMGEAVIEAARQAGVRITLLDACYLHGGIGDELDPVQTRFADGSAAAWAERVEALDQGHRARIAAAIHSVRAVDPGASAEVAAWANSRQRPLHAHVSEQVAENEECLAAHGRTPAALLEDAGAVSERFCAVHATHLTDADVDLLGGRGATCCLCPTTERDLADGVGPALRLAEAGARLALGSDSQAVIDQFEEARALELDERLQSGERGRHAAADLLRAATEDGHGCLGWPEAGRIAEGALADLVTVDLSSVRLAGTAAANAVEAVVFSAAAADVKSVIVGGERLVEEGAHLGLDVPGELQASIQALWP